MVKPKIMILDEPLSGVDEESRQSITDLLVKLTRKMAWQYFFPATISTWCKALRIKIVRVDNGKIMVGERKMGRDP